MAFRSKCSRTLQLSLLDRLSAAVSSSWSTIDGLLSGRIKWAEVPLREGISGAGARGHERGSDYAMADWGTVSMCRSRWRMSKLLKGDK